MEQIVKLWPQKQLFRMNIIKRGVIKKGMGVHGDILAPSCKGKGKKIVITPLFQFFQFT